MAIAIVNTRNQLATYYGSLGSYIGVATGNPGSAAAPANEATGGTPAYERVPTSSWGTATSGAITGQPVTISVPQGVYTHILLANTKSTATMIDNADVTDVNMSAQGQIVVTPTYTQT